MTHIMKMGMDTFAGDILFLNKFKAFQSKSLPNVFTVKQYDIVDTLYDLLHLIV